jgi:hypothetical protein
MSGLDEAVIKNVEACKQLSKITRTSLGPNGKAHAPERTQIWRPKTNRHARLSVNVSSQRVSHEKREKTRPTADRRDHPARCLSFLDRRHEQDGD